jgi:RNA polymerase sigma factor (sigma-70 family)
MDVAPGKLLRHIRQLTAPAETPRDGVLLRRWVARRDEDAFARLVHVHGPMVVGVCRRALGDAHEAEDVAQAVFLVLARKAAQVRPPERLAAWLHGVACRLAWKVCRASQRRRRREAQVASPSPAPDPLDEMTARELLVALDEEVHRLPEVYRLPVLLCCLGGQTIEEAAARLGWTTGSLRGRLVRARARLHARLVRRGLALPAALAALLVGQSSTAAGLPAALGSAAVAFAWGRDALDTGISARVMALAEGAIRPVALTRLKLGLVVLLTLGIAATSVAVAYQTLQARQGPTGEKQVAGPATPGAGQQAPARVDQYGDALPPRAVARIGSVRWWHGSFIQCPMVYTPDGKNLVCGEARAVRILDSTTGRELRRLQPPAGHVTSFTLAPDGKTIITAGGDSPVRRLWDVSTGKELRQLPGDQSGTALAGAFSPDGKRFASVTGQTVIRLWDVAGWKQTRQFVGHQRAIGSLVFLPGGKTLISGGGNCRTIRWWDTETGQEVRRLDVQLSHPRHLTVSPDGKRLAGVTSPHVLRLWDAATGQEVHRTELSQEHSSWCLCFSPDSRALACGNAVGLPGNQVLFFAAATGKELRRWDEDSYTTHLAYSPDGKVLAQAAAGVIWLRDATTGKPAVQQPGLSSYVLSVRFAPDGKTLLTSCFGGPTASWGPLSGARRSDFLAPPRAFAGRPGMLLATALSADGKKAALVDVKGVLHVWEPSTGKALCRIDDPPVGHDQAVFSPDGKVVVVKHQDNGIRLWDATAGKLLRTLPLARARRSPHPHVFSDDGRVLATAPASHLDRTIHLWDSATGKERGRLTWPDDTDATALAFTRDGKCLVAAHVGLFLKGGAVPEPTSLRLWELASGRSRRRFSGLPGEVRAMAISPDGKTLAAADSGGSIVLWEMASGEERGRFSGHGGWVWSLAFSPDGRLLASGSMDHTALVWDVTGLCADGKWAMRDLRRDELERLWADLGGKAARADRAVWTMAAGRHSVPFLAKKFRPVERVSKEHLARLIARLDSDEFAVRDQASKDLEKLAEQAVPAMREALAGRPSLEVRRRLKALLDKADNLAPSREELQVLRAQEVLEHAGTAAARQLLQALAKGAPGARLTNEAQAALQRLAQRDKKP